MLIVKICIYNNIMNCCYLIYIIYNGCKIESLLDEIIKGFFYEIEKNFFYLTRSIFG